MVAWKVLLLTNVNKIPVTRRDRDGWEQTTLKKQRASLRGVYLRSLKQTVTKRSNYFVWKDTSERVPRRYDNTVNKKQANPCVLKHLFWRSSATKKTTRNPRIAPSDTLLMSYLQKKSWLAPHMYIYISKYIYIYRDIHTYMYVHVFGYILKYGNINVNVYKIINWYINMYI